MFLLSTSGFLTFRDGLEASLSFRAFRAESGNSLPMRSSLASRLHVLRQHIRCHLAHFARPGRPGRLVTHLTKAGLKSA